MTVSSFPLNWPAGLARSPRDRREPGQFRTNYATAIKNVQTSLRQFGADSRKPVSDPVMSTNIDFMGKLKDNDPGVAIWFTWDKMQVCFAVDRYSTAAANLQAIHHIIEARRVELRHGSLQLVRQTFQGFLALPAPVGKEWWTVLGVERTATEQEIKEAFHRRAQNAHPDVGGSTDAMAELNTARDEALKARQ